MPANRGRPPINSRLRPRSNPPRCPESLSCGSRHRYSLQMSWLSNFWPLGIVVEANPLFCFDTLRLYRKNCADIWFLQTVFREIPSTSFRAHRWWIFRRVHDHNRYGKSRMDFKFKRALVDGKQVKVQIWDTAGQVWIFIFEISKKKKTDISFFFPKKIRFCCWGAVQDDHAELLPRSARDHVCLCCQWRGAALEHQKIMILEKK